MSTQDPTRVMEVLPGATWGLRGSEKGASLGSQVVNSMLQLER